MLKTLLIFSNILLITACTLIPEAPQVKPPIPQSFSNSIKDSNSSQSPSISKIQWNQFFQSEELKKLIAESLQNNREYRVALLNIEELKELYQIQRSDLIPNINANGGLNRRKLPRNALGSGGAFGGASGGAPQGFIQNQYDLSVGVTSYELDVFGRIRSLKKSALENYFASQSAKDSVRLTLIAEVAAAYMRLLADHELLNLAKKTVELQESVVDIIRERFKANVVSEIELRQAETLLGNLKTDAIAQKRAVKINENALRVLVGRPFKELNVKKSFEDIQDYMVPATTKLNSSVLLSRPDIKEAEHRLMSENAKIGAARAAFFPSISLTSSTGYLSTQFDNLVDEGSEAWQFSPRINLPIFTGGRNLSQLQVAKIRRKKSIQNYEYTIQKAFQETSNALISHERFKEQIEAQKSVVEAAQKASSLSELRYKSGVDSYLVTLDTRRSLYEAQRNLINQKYEYFKNYAYLHKSLGGGLSVQNYKN